MTEYDAVKEYEFDLTVGDVINLGNRTVTIVEIDGPNVSFRLDDGEELVLVGEGDSDNAFHHE